MAKVRYIGERPAHVPELGDLLVQPDEIYTVPDARFEAYMLHPHRWEPIEEPPAPAAKTAPKKSPAAKPATPAPTPAGAES